MKNLIKSLYRKNKNLALRVAKSVNMEINSSKSPRLKSGTRSKINREISNLISPKNTTKYFDKIPLKDLFNILDKQGVVVLQEDNSEWSGFLTGRKGEAAFDLAPKDSKDSEGAYTPYSNTVMRLTWYKMPSGKYEIVCYLP